MIKSDKIVIAAPMSYAGSAQRIWRITDNAAVRFAVLLPLIALAWVFVTGWYLTMYVFFGVLFIPYRLIRRGQRKNKLEQARHHEVLRALEAK